MRPSQRFLQGKAGVIRLLLRVKLCPLRQTPSYTPPPKDAHATPGLLSSSLSFDVSWCVQPAQSFIVRAG
jgi:hypothetical protein